MNKFKFYTIENELYYNGEIIVKYSIEYPEVALLKSKKEKALGIPKAFKFNQC